MRLSSISLSALILVTLSVSVQLFAHTGTVAEKERHISFDSDKAGLDGSALDRIMNTKLDFSSPDLGAYGKCPVVNFEIPGLAEVEAINGQCIPERENSTRIFGDQTAYSKDLAICRCLKNNPETAEGIAFHSLLRADEQASETRQKQDAMNNNISRLNMVLEAEQNAMRFQASTLPTSNAGGQFLAGMFTNRFKFNLKDQIRDISSIAERAYATNAPGGIPMKKIAIPEEKSDLLSPPDDFNESGYCFPMREYMTSKQLPQDPAFFKDIAALPEKFDENAWNYKKLKMDFIQAAGEVKNLEEALTKPEAKKIYHRIEFLERNPLYRNLFSSDHPRAAGKKRELWTKLKKTYGPTTDIDSRVEAFKELRSWTGGFFTAPTEMDEIVQLGASVNMEDLIREVPLRTTSIAFKHNPASLWSTAAVINSTPSLRSERTPAGGDVKTVPLVENFAYYCPRLEFSSRQNQYLLLQDLELKFATMYRSVWNNEEFANLSRKACGYRRPKNSNQGLDFGEFYKRECQVPKVCTAENRPGLLARFLTEFPVGEEPDLTPDELAVILPGLNGEFNIPRISKESADKSAVEGSNLNFLSSAHARTNLSAINSDFVRGETNFTPTTPDDVASRTPVANTAVSSSIPSPQASSVLSASSVQPVISVPLSGSTAVDAQLSAKPTETVRSIARQSDSEIESLREEIAALRASIENQRATSSPNSDDQLSSGSSELTALERRLASLIRENQDYKKELDKREDAPSKSSRRSRRVASDPSSFEAEEESQNSFAPASASSISPAASPASRGENIPSASLPRGNAALAPNRTAPGKANSNISRSTSVSASGSGAIIVSERTRAQFDELVTNSLLVGVTGSLPQEIYGRLANGDVGVLQERFGDRLPTEIGEIRRYNISNENAASEKVDIIVEKTATGFSVTFGQGERRNIAAEPETKNERNATRDGLVKELEGR